MAVVTRCAWCQHPEIVGGLDGYQCMRCGRQTDSAGRQVPQTPRARAARNAALVGPADEEEEAPVAEEEPVAEEPTE